MGKSERLSGGLIQSYGFDGDYGFEITLNDDGRGIVSTPKVRGVLRMVVFDSDVFSARFFLVPRGWVKPLMFSNFFSGFKVFYPKAKADFLLSWYEKHTEATM